MDQNNPTLDESLLDAYYKSVYSVFRPSIDIKIGEHNEDLAVFLFDNNAFSWAFVSACNPFSINISALENQKRTSDLIAFVKEKNWRFLRGEGHSDQNNWKEESLLILDISKNEAEALANQFEQNAFVFGYLDKTPELVICKR